MEHVSGVVSVAVTGLLIGLVGVLVARKRKHLKLVVRLVDQKDQKLIRDRKSTRLNSSHRT